jgi:hypothetical protein
MRFVWLAHSLRNARGDLTQFTVLDTAFFPTMYNNSSNNKGKNNAVNITFFIYVIFFRIGVIDLNSENTYVILFHQIYCYQS